ncbi:MAG: PepSY-associated TM helix domain-containing protein [Sphingobium sp.]
MKNPRTIYLWLWVHKWSSLISMLFLLMLCGTGLPLIFHEEISDWLDPHPSLPSVALGTPTPTLESIVRKAQAARPPGHALYWFFIPDDEPRTVTVITAESLKPAGGGLPGTFFQSFDRRTGEALKAHGDETGFMSVMFRLHTDMFAGLPGTLFLGAIGLLLVIAVISGVVIYTPFMRKLDFATVRSARGSRVLWLDLHNLLGVVTVAWLLVVGGTGAINTLYEPLFEHWRATEIADMLAPYKNAPPVAQRVPVDTVLAVVHKAAPERFPVTVIFPGAPASGNHHYLVVTKGSTPLTSRIMIPLLIDAQTGKLTAAPDPPWYMKMLSLSQPLHFGDYGGMPLKIIWAVLTVITIIVLSSGIYLWLRKPLAVRRSDRAVAKIGSPALARREA